GTKCDFHPSRCVYSQILSPSRRRRTTKSHALLGDPQMYIDFSSSRHLSRLFRQDSDDTRSHQNWLARLAFCHRNGWIKVDSSEPDDWFDPNNFDLIKISSKGPYSQF